MWQRRSEPVLKEPETIPGSKQGEVENAKIGVVGNVEEKVQPRTQNVTKIGSSVVIEGELTGRQDLIIDGRVDGTVCLPDHVLTVGPNGCIRADVVAKAVIVLGEVTGDIRATEKVDLRECGSVDGNIVSPSVSIVEGAHFLGSVVMQQPELVVPSNAKPKTTLRK